MVAGSKMDTAHSSLSLDSIHERARWFCRVRWAAVAGHALVFIIARVVLGLALVPATFIAVETLLMISNVALSCGTARIRSTTPLGVILLFDVTLLTVLLAAYGGQMNPFSTVYLVQVVLAALFIGHIWTWIVALFATVGFISLFFLSDAGAMHMHHSPGNFDLHLQGMLAAFVLISFLIAGFVSRMRLAIDAQERELLGRKSNEERLAALTQLAAGAAHELGTPLATMSVILSELRSGIAVSENGELREDLECLAQQLERCEQILRRMAPEAGDISGEMPTNFVTEQLIGKMREALPPPYQDRVRVAIRNDPGALYLPLQSVAHALASLVKNGLDASGAGAAVTLDVSLINNFVSFDVIDSGAGMDRETLRRVGEPFFTTKEPGRGTGLGVFLCRLLVSRINGALDFDSLPGQGTRVTLKLPLAVRWNAG